MFTQLNTEFQRITKGEKKAFFNEQCIKIEGNHRRGKTSDLFRKTGNSKGTFHPKMGTIKDRNSRGIEVEQIKKRQKKYTEELYKKDVNDPDNHNGVVSQPEPDVLQCEVTWTLESTAVNKASGCNGIPGELFKTLKDDAIKALHSICQQIWKTQQWPQEKVNPHLNSQEE